MSKENVVFFSKAINKYQDLKQRIAKAEATVDAWVKIAHDAGFEFTPEEFASVVGETLGRTVTTDNAVSEYLAAQASMGSVELSQKGLEKVVGGRMRMMTNGG
jgi:hypothetical protein